MHDLEIKPGVKKLWYENGVLKRVYLGLKKRIRRGRSTKTVYVCRMMSAAEYARYDANKLTKPGKQS